MKSRLSTGGALVVVLISALVLVLLGVGFIFFSKIFGGGREMQNAVDSGSLNAAKTALLRPGTNAQPGNADEAQFLGFSPNDGKNPDFSLGNINRVWGQALLVSLNTAAMQMEGSAGPEADDNAHKVVDAAKAINDRVAAALKPVSNLPAADLKTAFLNTSNSNTLKMVSANANDQLEISEGAQIGYQDAKGQSNIYGNFSKTGRMFKDIVASSDLDKFASDYLSKISAGAYGGQAVTKPDGQKYSEGGSSVVNGYQDIQVDDKTLYFVPLRPEAKPHMLSGTEFNATAPQLKATNAPINNSFFTKGKMKEDKSNTMLDFAAIALAEPVDPAYGVSIPRGFIKVKNWKGFPTEGTILDANTNNAAARNADQRGMQAAEYANHQLLMARSSYAGPGHPDQFTSEMGNPYFGLVDPTGNNPLKNGDNEPVYGRQSQVQELMDINDAIAEGKQPPKPAPLDSDPRCGDRFATDLPSGMKCSDIKTGPQGFQIKPAEASVSVNGNGEVVATNPDAASDALSLAIVQNLIDHVHDSEQAFGSDVHPHIWSVDPRRVHDVNNVANFMKTGPSASDPFAWLYTGQLVMPNNPESGHFSRPGNASQSPITFGRAGTIWEYVENANPGTSGGAVEQAQVLARLTQRVLEIKPDFAQGGDLQSEMKNLLSQATVDLNQDAYVFLDATDNKMKVAVVKGDSFDQVGGAPMPQWLKDQVNALGSKVDGLADGRHPELLGKTVFYGASRRITTQPTDGQGNFVENVPGDWGYTEPYTNANNPPPGAQMVNIMMTNKYVFRPCTGYQGQLAVLELKSFIHNPNCPPVDYTASPPVYPEECPCTNFPVGSVPQPTPTDPNTPNGWTKGVGVPTDTVLPNCSHTGAC